MLTIRELWCAKAATAYPSAESACRCDDDDFGGAVWGGRSELSGPPIDVRVQPREDRFFSAALGLLSILRRPLNVWEMGSLEKIRDL